MVTALLLLFSFTLGLTVGLQINAIQKRISLTVDRLNNRLDSIERTKKSGVVRPGLSTSMPVAEPSDDSRKSAVVRPRPQPTDQDDKNLALSSVRNRVNNG